MCQLAMYNYVCVSPNGRGEVSVEGDVEGIMMGAHPLRHSRAKIHSQLEVIEE